MGGNKHARTTFGAMEFGDVPSTFSTPLVVIPGDYVGLVILNSLNAAVEITLGADDETPAPLTVADKATSFELAAAEPLVLNLLAMGRLGPKSTLYARYASGAPTSGSLRVTAIR